MPAAFSLYVKPVLPDALTVIVPLLVQLAMVVDALTVIVLPAQGSTGTGAGEGLLFEQDIKLTEARLMIIAKQINEIFFDIQLVLACIEIKKAKVACLKKLIIMLYSNFYVACSTHVCYAGFCRRVALCADYFFRDGVNLIPIKISVVYNFTAPSPTPARGIAIPGDAMMEKFFDTFFSIPAESLNTENKFWLPV